MEGTVGAARSASRTASPEVSLVVEGKLLPGMQVVRKTVHRDGRGFLVELLRAEELRASGIHTPLVQFNHSRSVRGTIRGLHWQRDPVQAKLVTVIRGAVLDVVADVRPDSPTFGQHVMLPLEPGVSVWVPAGYAHGFAVTSADADVVYGLGAPYAPGEGRGVRWDDPTLAIDWPVRDPVLSDADRTLPTLAALDPADLPVGTS